MLIVSIQQADIFFILEIIEPLGFSEMLVYSIQFFIVPFMANGPLFHKNKITGEVRIKYKLRN